MADPTQSTTLNIQPKSKFEVIVGFIGQKHVWLSLVAVFLLVFGIARVDQATETADRLIRAAQCK